MQNRRCEDDDDEEEEEEEEEDTSCEMFEMCARRIQDCWRSHQNRKVFQLLMRTVCSAEACLTPALLQQLSPQEANLLRDPSLQCKVRFRFAGPLFPPVIVFKVFHTGRGGSYLSGKKLFQPSNQATADTCRMMGNRKFMNLMMEDENHWQGRTIWHPAEVMCTRDYMQFSSHLDKLPACVGGRGNGWRCLSLKPLRGGGGKGVEGGKGVAVTCRGSCRSLVAPPPSAVSSSGPRTPKRRSARAQAVAAHMRNIYRLQQEEKDRDEEVNASPRLGHMTDSQMMKHKEDEKDDFISDAFTRLTLCDKIDCDWEEEAELLCSWSNQLSLDSI
ncbi:uncharacterized protein CXorf58 homolog isoform X2 [Silurus meridionalis]|uniref:uncharacterized protein CXorf58 homolog isoform X2 n=1 Tax=Silurus meridionalis TaxID=175797 RepID=UPI001EEB1CD5|nr:uncharacterized protein CXorf58 homolog isoform X2 [Silurus meridionalis]